MCGSCNIQDDNPALQAQLQVGLQLPHELYLHLSQTMVNLAV